MPLTLEQIPMSGDGVVRGTYRVEHKDWFNDAVCGVLFTGKLSEPVTGLKLRRLVGAMGHELRALIPVDAEARAALGIPEPVQEIQGPATVGPTPAEAASQEAAETVAEEQAAPVAPPIAAAQQEQLTMVEKPRKQQRR